MASFKASHTWSTIDLYGPNGPRVHPPATAIGTRRDKIGLCCYRIAQKRDHQRAQPEPKVSEMPGMMVRHQNLAE